MNPLQRLASACFHGLLFVGCLWVIYAVIDGFLLS